MRCACFQQNIVHFRCRSLHTLHRELWRCPDYSTVARDRKTPCFRAGSVPNCTGHRVPPGVFDNQADRGYNEPGEVPVQRARGRC